MIRHASRRLQPGYSSAVSGNKAVADLIAPVVAESLRNQVPTD
ncbi:MAG: hypothetical protein ABGZ53_20730 [Fuerstiella sp.]